MTYTCYAMHHSIALLLLQDEPLDIVRREAEFALDFVRNAKFRDMEDIITPLRQFIVAMQGQTSSISTFNDDRFVEEHFETQLLALQGGRMGAMICWYWVTKAKVRFMAGAHAEALEAVDKATTLLWASTGHFPLIDYHFYAALTLARISHTRVVHRASESVKSCFARTAWTDSEWRPDPDRV